MPSHVSRRPGLLTQAGYFADDHPSVLTQGGVTQTYTEDPAGRTQTRQAGTVGAPVETYHYADDSDSPSWSESGTTWTQNRMGVEGELLATKLSSTGAITTQYTNLHGDVVGAGTWSGTYDEFGNAQTANGRQYGWLGGPRRSTESAGGLIQMGERTYLAPIGRFLQTDPVDGGSANDYDYTNQDPINQTDLNGECPVCVVILGVEVAPAVAAAVGAAVAVVAGAVVGNQIAQHGLPSLTPKLIGPVFAKGGKVSGAKGKAPQLSREESEALANRAQGKRYDPKALKRAKKKIETTEKFNRERHKGAE